VCRRIFGTLFVIFLIFIGICVYLATRPSPKIAVVAPVSHREVADAEHNLQSAFAPINHRDTPEPGEFAPPIEKPDPMSQPLSGSGQIVNNGKISVHISEGDVNALLAGNHDVRDHLADEGICNAQIAFLEPDTITAVAQVGFQGEMQDITVIGTLDVGGNGTLEFLPSDFRMGALPMPASSYEQILKKETARILQVGLARLPITVKAVRVKGDQLILTGPPKTN
jgi:hypothetical protein